MENNTQEKDTLANVPFEIPEEYYEQTLIKALKHSTTLGAIVERALEIEFLKGKPYPKATSEELLEIQAALAELND